MCACVCLCVCVRSEEHTSELQSHLNLVCRLLLEKKKALEGVFLGADAGGVRCLLCEARARARCTSADRCRSVRRAWAPQQWCRRAFFFNDTATTEIYTLSLHDALPI